MTDTLLDNLRNEIASKQAVIVVGAGVSIGATGNHECASWTGLLHDGVDRCVDIGRLKKEHAQGLHSQINSGDLDLLLSAAEAVSTKLAAPEGGEYRRWLRERLGSLRAIRREVLEALAALGVPLATTNYDGLLEEVTGLRPVTWRDGSRVERVLRGDERAILHFHGYWESPDSVILGIRSYEQVLGDAHAQTILRALQTMRCLVFVGCGAGLEDPNFGRLLEWTGKVFAGSEYRRFRLALESERETLQQKHPDEQRLFVISFGQGHSDLAPFLRSLVPAGPEKPSTEPEPLKVSGEALLPANPRCFGREQELADLVDNLLARQPEPTPILGAPGIGKSNLSLAALHESRVATRYGPRRYFVRCDGVRSRSDLAAAIARTIGLTLAPAIEPGILTELRKAPGLLVLDHVGTPWEADMLAVEELLGTLGDVSGLALLVSLRGSQRPAGVNWREPFELTPLKLPAARQTFLAIAGKTFQTDPHLDDLLNGVDCVPLAITLLAYSAEGEPDLSGLWQRWQGERTSMLQRADAKDRLTNMELSYEISLADRRMTPEGKRLLSLLALLPGGLAHCDLGAVMPERADAAASTLRKTGLGFDEVARLRALAPLREHVRQKHPTEPTDRTRLIAHFIGLASNLAGHVGEKGGREAIARLAAEVVNIEAMILRGLEGDTQKDAIDAAIKWCEFVRFTGAGSSRPINQAAVSATSLGDELRRGNCIKGLGDIALARSEHTEARRWYEQARPLYQQVGSVLGEANCIFGVGEVALARSEHAEARRCYEQARSLYQQVGDVLGEANCIFGVGDIALARGEYDTAYNRFKEALPLYERQGNERGQGNCHFRCGQTRARSAQPQSAAPLYAAALACYERHGDPYPIGAVHYFWTHVSGEPERNQHREAARAAWQGLERGFLIGMAAMDGIGGQELAQFLEWPSAPSTDQTSV